MLRRLILGGVKLKTLTKAERTTSIRDVIMQNSALTHTHTHHPHRLLHVNTISPGSFHFRVDGQESEVCKWKECGLIDKSCR